MPARIQGLRLGVGINQQGGLGTPSISTASTSIGLWKKLDKVLPFLDPGTETDKEWIGKGNEWISQVFKTAIQPRGVSIEKYGSAEWVLLSFGFGLGVCTVAGGLYTIHPLDPAITLELPYTTLVAQVSEGGGTATDVAMLGMIVDSVDLVFHYGPTLASCKCNTTFAGSGISIVPSGITLPTTPVVENFMSASSMAISVNGVDYVSTKQVLLGSISWKNNPILPLMFTPGSGLDVNGFAVGNRIFIGDRDVSLTFTAFLEASSTQYAALVAQSTGVTTVTFTHDSGDFVTFTFNVTSFEKVEQTQENGIVAVTCTMAVHNDPTVVGGLANNVCVITGKATGISNIAQ
jgi:hypothetical protein